MQKETIETQQAPAAIGPYSQGIRSGNMLFISGQIPMDPKTGDMVQGDIKEQTRRVIRNLMEILATAGASLDNVVKTTVFITDMNNFPLVNEAYAEFFQNQPPARACVEVSRLPKDAQVEIEAIASV